MYLHFAHAYLHSVIQDGVPWRRGRIARNWDFASYFMTTKQKSKESTNTKKEKCMHSQRSSYERTLLDQYLWRLFIVHRGIFVQPLLVFLSSNLVTIFCVFKAGLDSASMCFHWREHCRHTDAHAYACSCFTLTQQNNIYKHKLISIRKWKIFHFLML